ncbi:hypothetical protein AKJ45_00070 [candidate division MSBL1 archaeon SCGC-AAA261F19]|uniref:UPF0201 protein AKJ45_00070 n=2 Tax=candidate division MSBL1 TaxID=215777 RepID=A0A133VBR2_9EURY|nr:hypothetical protein AKJ43_00875 [candidate division MSBL1 archaeon SCGC-AAA261D19]KXB03888.1 hypothetical protein AKJ45_00070 [candidate division MSBL1 archaeon SCGC-AAA261F19]
MRIEVRAKVHHTEDPDKIKDVIRKIFPNMNIGLEEDSVMGRNSSLDSLEQLKNKLRLQAIRDSARSVMLEGRKNNSLSFMLNRQAATVGKISFSNGETALGPIIVTIESENLDRVVDYLAPSTRGK